MTTFTNTTDQVEALYVGYFGRAGDPAGTNYWVNNLNNKSLTLAQEAASFAVQPEATTKYPYLANPSISNPSQFIDQVYQNLFNRLPDAAGKAYWTAQLVAAGGNPTAVGQFILNVISGATGADSVAITSKVGTARYYTEVASNNSIPWTPAVQAQSIVEVTATTDPATQAQQKTVTDNALAITVTVAGAAGLAPNQPYNISDTIANETAVSAAAVMNKAAAITATDGATAAQVATMAGYTNTGTKAVASLTDTAANIAALTNAQVGIVTGTATASSAATGAQASTLAAFTKAVVYSISDTTSATAASTGLNKAVNITTSGVGTAADAQTIMSATNTGATVIANVSDTAAAIAALTFGANDTVNGVIVNGTATVAQATTIKGNAKILASTYSLSDTVGAEAAASAAVLNGATNITATGVGSAAQVQVLVNATNSGATVIAAMTDNAAAVTSLTYVGSNDTITLVTVTGTASVAQAIAIKSSAVFVTSIYSISDGIASVAVAPSVVLNGATDITATGVGLASQAQTIMSATNTGATLIAAVTDNAAAVAGMTIGANDTISLVTVTGTATVAQAAFIKGSAGITASSYSLSDTTALEGAASAAVLNGATDITGTGVGTAAAAQTIMSATNSGVTVIANVSDLASAIAALTFGANDTVTGVIVNGTATVAEATTIKGNAQILASTYSLSDTLLAESGASAAVLNGATNITATGPASSAANAQIVMSATNSGLTVIAAVSDAAGAITGLVFGANDTITSVTVTGTASVADATAIKANAQILGSSYSLSDTLAAEAAASAAVLNGATNITATGPASTAADAQIVMNATNTGTTVIAAVADTALASTAMTIGANDTITSLVVTTAATVAQGTSLETQIMAGKITGSTFSISDAFTTVQAALTVGGATTAAVNNAVTLTAMGSAAIDNINMSAYARGVTIEGAGAADVIVGSTAGDTFLVTALVDFPATESVNGLGGTDKMQFNAAGTVTYGTTAGGDLRQIQSVETLALATGLNNVAVYEGTGLTRVEGMTTAGSVFVLNNDSFLNGAQTAFAAAPAANAAAVIGTGLWFFDNTGADGVLTYWDQVTGAAVTLTLVGVAGLGAMTVSLGGALQYAAPATLLANYGTSALNTLTVSGAALGIVDVTLGGVVTNGGFPVTVTGGAFAPATVTGITLAGVTGGFGSTIAIDGTVEPALASVIGTSGNDNITLADANFAALGRVVAIDGQGGTNTLTIAAQTFNATIGAGGILPGASTLTNIQNLVLGAGTGGWTLTLGAVANLAITNNTASASTIILGGVGSQSYSATSTLVDNVTLGASGQRVTDLDNTSADVVQTTVANSLNSTFTSTTAGLGDSLVFLSAGTIGLAGTASATEMGISGVETVALFGVGGSTVNSTLTQNIIIDATAMAASTATINGTGANTITVLQANAALSSLALSGSSTFVVTGGTTGGTVSDTGTGSFTVNMVDLVAGATEIVNSVNAATVNAAAVATIAAEVNDLSIGGAGNFTINGVGAGAQVGTFNVNLLASHTGTTAITLGANSSTLNTNALNGAITVNAAALTGTETITGAHSVTVNNLIGVGGTIAGGTATGDLTVNTNDLLGLNTITTGFGNDTIVGISSGSLFTGGAETIVTGSGTNGVSLTGVYGATSITGGAGVDTVTLSGTFVTPTITTAGGNDVINTSAVTSGAITIDGGVGADQITVASSVGGTKIVVGTAGAGVSLVGDMDTVTGTVSTAQNTTFATGFAGTSMTAATIATSDFASLAGNFSVATAGVGAAWLVTGAGVIATVLAGTAAGTYLLVNEAAGGATFDGAVDVAVHLVGTVGPLTAANIVV